VQECGVPGKVPRNFRTDLPAIHVNRKIAVAADPYSDLRLFIRYPAERRAVRIVEFGEATSMPSRSASSCWQAFQTASKV
jgi:hypothetical protein